MVTRGQRSKLSRDDQNFNVRECDDLEAIPQCRGHLGVGMENVECMQVRKGLKKGRKSWYHTSGLISRKDDVHSSAGLKTVPKEDGLKETTPRLTHRMKDDSSEF